MLTADELIKREGLPERKEKVVVKITELTPYGCFCELLEYKNVKGFIPLTEVSRKRIKKLTDAVREGMITVGEILEVRETEAGECSVDVSLRRVSEEEKRRRLNEYRLERRLANLILVAAQRANAKDEEVLHFVRCVQEYYGSLQEFIEEYRKRPEVFDQLPVDISDKFKEELRKVFGEYIAKLREKYQAIVRCYSLDKKGALYVKEALIKLREEVKRIEKIDKVELEYKSSPEWYLFFETDDIKHVAKKIYEAAKKVAEEYKNKVFLEVEIPRK